ncbi:hypothetical protein BDR06DRAFT_420653 [Suillus hirtellus]|nr:hypothetical protein BDR06DRAFT_420653 [Suillus hirtellus]
MTFTRGATKSSWTTHCEQHISPLGMSCFVNNNTQITSCKKPTPESIIEGHSKFIRGLTCLGTSCNILSASGDGSIFQWTIDGVQWKVLGLVTEEW